MVSQEHRRGCNWRSVAPYVLHLAEHHWFMDLVQRWASKSERSGAQERIWSQKWRCNRVGTGTRFRWGWLWSDSIIYRRDDQRQHLEPWSDRWRDLSTEQLMRKGQGWRHAMVTCYWAANSWCTRDIICFVCLNTNCCKRKSKLCNNLISTVINSFIEYPKALLSQPPIIKDPDLGVRICKNPFSSI